MPDNNQNPRVIYTAAVLSPANSQIREQTAAILCVSADLSLFYVHQCPNYPIG